MAPDTRSQTRNQKSLQKNKQSSLPSASPPTPSSDTHPSVPADAYNTHRETWDRTTWGNLRCWNDSVAAMCFLSIQGIWKKEWGNLTPAQLKEISWGSLTFDPRHKHRIAEPPAPVPPQPQQPSADTSSIHGISANLTALQARFDIQFRELQRSIEYTQAQQDDLLRKFDAARTPVPTQTREPEAAPTAVVITGLATAEADTAADTVRALFTSKLQLPESLTQTIQDVTSISNSREPKEGEKPRPQKIIVRFTTPASVHIVLRSAPRLKEENCRRKESGESPIGIDRELSKEERRRRNALWGHFRDAKIAGKSAYWRGARLFVDGGEIPPPI